MIDHIWSVLCESSAVDQDTHLVSIFNVIEELTLSKIPAEGKKVPIVLNIISLWVRSDTDKPEKGYSRYTFVSPGKETLVEVGADVDLMKYERLRSRVQFAGLVLPTPGRYFFHVEFRQTDKQEWKEVASIPVKMNFPAKQD